MADNAPRACKNCKSGKRKCDKALPHCSRCARLALHCEYERTTPPQHPHNASQSVMFLPTHFSRWSSCTQAFFRSTYEAFVQNHRFRSDYLDTVHQWLPIIDEKSFMAESLDGVDPIQMLLFMATYLIVQRPDGQAGRRSTLHDQYYAVKQLYFKNLAEMTAKPPVKLLQSGVLIATYEYGHGLIESACYTLGPCISAGMMLSLHNNREPSSQSPGHEVNSQREESFVWWAITITDRILCLSFPPGSRLPLARGINEDEFLVELHETNDIGSVGLCSFYGTNFYHQIQSSVLIGQVLNLINSRDPFSAQSEAQFELLDVQIRQAIYINLKMETEKLNAVSEGLAMNRSVLMILHQWRYNAEISIGRIESSERSKMVIDSITNVMVDTVHEFLPRVHAGWKKSRHPQGIQSVFMAAKGLKATMNNEHGLRELLEMLRVQSRRWCIAKTYLGLLGE